MIGQGAYGIVSENILLHYDRYVLSLVMDSIFIYYFFLIRYIYSYIKIGI